jgi:hypothetical protein
MYNCAIGFPNVAEILSWFEPHPNGVALSSRESNLSCTQFSYQGLVHLDHNICRLDGESNARNFHIWSSRVRTMKTIVRSLNFECSTCLMDERIRTGIHIVQTVAAVFPYLCIGNKFHICPDGCKLEQFETSRHRVRSERKVLVVRTEDAWIVGRPDGITCHLDGCKGTAQHVLNSAQSLLEAHNWRVNSK